MTLLEVLDDIYRDCLLECEEETPHGITSKEYSLKASGVRKVYERMKSFLVLSEIGNEILLDESFNLQ